MSTLRKGVSTATTLLFILTQFLLCTAFPKYGDDHFSSGRSLLDYEDDTGGDQAVFFVVLVVGLLIVTLLSCCLCSEDCCNSESSTSRDTSAIIHPPPRQPVQQLNFAYSNTGFVPTPPSRMFVPGSPVGVIPEDQPPNYSAVVLSDLAQGPHKTAFPMVAPSAESPPAYFQQ